MLAVFLAASVVDGHGYMTNPKVTFTAKAGDPTQFIATIESSASGLSGTFNGAPADNVAAFTKAFGSSKYSSLKEFINAKATVTLCGTSRKQQVGSGYSNLLSHLTSTHPDFEETYQASVATDAPLSSFGFVSEATQHRYQWLQWVVERNMPISEVDDPLTRSMASWKPVSSKTLKLDMQTCSANVGDVIEKELGDIMHYVGIYGVTFVNGKRRERLLSLSPLVDGSQDAEVHIAMFKRVLSLYNKNVVAALMELPLVGCASHRYNLAVNRYLAAYESELAAVNSLMVQLRHVNNAAELAKYTDLKPVKRNVTRWSSTFEMLLELLEELKKLDSVCKRLQADVRVLFDQVADDYPDMAPKRKNPRSVQRYPPASSGKRKERSSSDYANEILRGGKKARSSGAASATYHDLAKVVPPTSNTVERLFSQCKFILTPQRSCMLPANFEMLAFLRVNRDLWNATTTE
ncbi:Phosphoenolpyruvate carboxykinase [Phytophthora cinnamomi]|uniref:Phosphoenolpyruvate carboxykinase n=1 Tax=Phytophthora cinnamomi TaxID=4785 RepID=UPI0035596AD4|nr:Phosphoenolpyruvate carboxykinase [Phytophthora cinnamomi]